MEVTFLCTSRLYFSSGGYCLVTGSTDYDGSDVYDADVSLYESLGPRYIPSRCRLVYDDAHWILRASIICGIVMRMHLTRSHCPSRMLPHDISLRYLGGWPCLDVRVCAMWASGACSQTCIEATACCLSARGLDSSYSRDFDDGVYGCVLSGSNPDLRHFGDDMQFTAGTSLKVG